MTFTLSKFSLTDAELPAVNVFTLSVEEVIRLFIRVFMCLLSTKHGSGKVNSAYQGQCFFLIIAVLAAK